MTGRYRAPAEDGGLLADPPLDEVGRQLEINSERLDTARAGIAGIPLAEYRTRAVDEVLRAARRYHAEGGEPVPPAATRLLVAGHQPDFFHPGVWVKKFVLHGLAARHGRAPLNLVVDNDMAKSAALHVPVLADDPNRVTAVSVPFDRPKGDRPHEEYHVTDRALFDSLPGRLAEHTRAWGFDALAHQIWPKMAAELDRGATLGTAASRVRRSLERRWGVTNFELPVSRLSETDAFDGFVFTVLADLPRFADHYNAALRDYRAANHIRSRNHPAPELVGRGDALEAPFWVWRDGSPRRERLFVRPVAGGWEVLAGETAIARVGPVPDHFAAAWAPVREAGWKVRPRALTLTLFARICLGDGFIHGIGGGKYDEVTDDIIRRFFGIEPPGYAVVSATLRLPLPHFPPTPDSVHRAERRVRDLHWNPQKFAGVAARFGKLLDQKARVAAHKPDGKAQRRQWFRQLQDLTSQMRPAAAGDLTAAETDLERLRAELAANEVLGSREYAWPLFPERMLREYFARFR